MRVGLTIRGRDARKHAADLLALLARTNVSYLRDHPETPPLYESGVRYQREPKGKRERWQGIAETLRRKRGDCEDLVAWRVAELRMRGIGARTALKRSGIKLMHAIVVLPDGSIEDPSRKLGMVRP